LTRAAPIGPSNGTGLSDSAAETTPAFSASLRCANNAFDPITRSIPTPRAPNSTNAGIVSTTITNATTVTTMFAAR